MESKKIKLSLSLITTLIFTLGLCNLVNATTLNNLATSNYKIIVKPKRSKPGEYSSSNFFILSNRLGINFSQIKPMANQAYTISLETTPINDLAKLNRTSHQEIINRILSNIQSDPNIEYAVIDRKVYAYKTEVDHQDQWNLFEPPGGIQAPQAWSLANTQGNHQVAVAVVDTGITPHKDLINILPGYSFVNDNNDVTDTGNGTGFHGTHVAGTIAANGTILGMAPNVSIMPIQVLGEGGEGSQSDVMDGVLWSAGDFVPGTPINPYPAKVINMSLGSPGGCDPAWEDVFERLNELNVTVIVAAGNENDDANNYSPASCHNVISVAATDYKGVRAPYSNYGNNIAVAAPGGTTTHITQKYGIVSTINNNAYAYYQGTSMATPHVTGIIALLYSIYPNLTPKQALQILKESVTKFPYSDMQKDPHACLFGNTCGKGIVNAVKAVQKLKEVINQNTPSN